MYAIIRHNRDMILAFGIAFLILVGAVGVYFLVLTPHAANMPTIVSDSYEAARASQLKISKNFDVTMCDTRIGDMFSSFPEDKDDVLTPQGIAEEVDRISNDIVNAHHKRRPLHFA